MRVLIIDDIEVSVKGILDACDENNWEKSRVDFEDASAALIDFNPDVVVLDWRQDADNIDIGGDVLDKIWDITFRPIVVFSANATVIDIDSKLQKSNMLKIIGKGDEVPVVEFLKSMEKFVSSLELYRKEMSLALIEGLNSVDNLKNIDNVDESSISYILSKRTSAFFDDKYISNISPSWVQYMSPPISESLTVCDIIRIYDVEKDMSNAGDPEEYCIVLTPSCDMVKEPGREPKISHVLCAHCYPKNNFHNMGLHSEPTQKQITAVEKLLHDGSNRNLVALPGFSNVIPYMTADLKKIELVSLEEIASNITSCNDNSRYVRVASICSPFREQIVWAHLQNSCRPGVPDRDTNLWAKELLSV